MSDALNLEPGALVGGYTLMSRLGSGAMGSVWRVHDDGGEEYAMKILRDSLADDRSTASARDQITARERLRREAMALKKVNHPGVCGIVDMELDDSLAFIVTELIEGKNLRDDIAANGPYVADDLERLASKLMDAVRAVHAAGIVHRDIKPTNVMVSATGPVLVDFGIAMGEGESHVTRTGLVMGTPGFIAPEIIEGTESDEITDWWSVSSVLAFAATGKPVFGTKPMMAVLEREASGNANLTGLPATTMTAFRAALNPDRSKRCTPEQLLQAITVDAFNPGAWQQYDDDAAQSGQTDVMRPFDHTGLRNPRLLWRPHEPAESGEKPTAAVTKAGMPRQTAMPGVRPALQRIIGQSAPSPYATVPPIPRLPNAGQAADAASPVFDGYHQSGQEQMPEPRTEPYRSGKHRYREISRLLRHPATTGRRRCPASPHLCRRPCRSAPKRPNRCAHSRHRFCPPPPCHSIPRSASDEPCPCNRSRRRPYPRTMRT